MAHDVAPIYLTLEQIQASKMTPAEMRATADRLASQSPGKGWAETNRHAAAIDRLRFCADHAELRLSGRI